MLNWISCTLGGLAILLAFNTVAPADRASLSDLLREPSFVAPVQHSGVNRAAKGDRLVAAKHSKREATTSDKNSAGKKAPAHKMLVGCEPVFSPLSVSARLNTTGRCLS